MRGRGYLVKKRLLLFYLPFTLCFIIPNLIKMAPWIWDNIKVLYYWWLASAPLVALLLARLWRQGPIRRVIAVLLFVCVTLAGTLDVAGIALRSIKYQVFDADGVKLRGTDKTTNSAACDDYSCAGSQHARVPDGASFVMGYPGHIWTHGLEFVQRESEIKRIYLGAPDADQLLRNYNIEYAVVGPHERIVTTTITNSSFTRFEKVGEVGGYSSTKSNHSKKGKSQLNRAETQVSLVSEAAV